LPEENGLFGYGVLVSLIGFFLITVARHYATTTVNTFDVAVSVLGCLLVFAGFVLVSAFLDGLNERRKRIGTVLVTALGVSSLTAVCLTFYGPSGWDVWYLGLFMPPLLLFGVAASISGFAFLLVPLVKGEEP
jgi:hypothetical protein